MSVRNHQHRHKAASLSLLFIVEPLAQTWNVVVLFSMLLTAPVLPEWSSTGCFLLVLSLSSNRHLSSCGILMTRSPKVICLQDHDTMASVPPSRNFISLTNKRKEYSERRILG